MTSQYIANLTLVILTAAIITFIVQVIRQRRGGHPGSFPTILLIVLIGWLTTEALRDAFGELFGGVDRLAHFAVMSIFAVTLTFQLKHSLVE